MRFLEQFRMVMLMLFRRKRESKRLDEELQFHLDQQVKENIACGLSPEKARTAAVRLFGNPLLVREQARSIWSWSSLESVARNLRHGVRRLARSPGFALTAILVMALGIGATTSLFTIVRSVLLNPLPFRDSSRLVMLYEHFRAAASGDDPFNVVSPADFEDWRRQTHSFQDMAAWRIYGVGLTGDHAELPEGVAALGASWNLLSVLGVRPALGRSFVAGEDRPGGTPVVLLTWSLFERRFGANPAILGKQIRLDTLPYTVIGVLPRWLNYPDPHVQLWVPYGQTFTPDVFAMHANHQSHVVARLQPGVSAAAAVKPVSTLQYQLHLENLSKPVAEEVWSRPMIDDVVRDVKTPLLVLLAAVSCMLLIACLNVSNLLVARGAARRKEVAVRSALGGSRLALIGEQMAESVLICVAGGALGLGFSFAATRWLAAHWKDLPRAGSIHFDGVVVAVAIVIIAFAALAAGLLPAISSTRADVFAALQESSRSVGGSVSRAALRKTLLTAEIALTVILLIAAGLLFKSFLHLRTVDLGCATDHVITMKYRLPSKEYDTQAKVIAFHTALLDSVRRLTGVRAAGLVSKAPGDGLDGDDVFTIPEHPSTSFQLQDDASFRTADPGYFSAMQIPLIRGRFFTEQERLNRDHFIIVSRQFAQQFFPHEDAIGRRINLQWNMKPEDYQIIGVVGDTVYDVSKPTKATMYFPILSGLPAQTGYATVVARTAGDPLALALPIQKQIAALNPELPISDVYTMQQILGRSTASQSFSATLLLAFASLSLLLAAVGLYGVLSYLVTQRITEIGIRIALGAQRTEVLRLVLLDGLRPVFVGLLIGLGGGIAAGALIRSLLYGASPFDPLVFAAMGGMLLLVSILACALPAIRAARIEPMQALRME